jgi:cysteine synthase A
MLNFFQSDFYRLRTKLSVPDITHAVGMTPVVELQNIHPICQTSSCWLKLESCNPGGSIKEKNAVYLVDQAERKGLLRRGGTIVESSSGNFGVGLAIVGAVRGYRVIIVIDAKTTPFFRRLLSAYGAELWEVPLSECDASGSMQKARMQRAQILQKEIPGAWYPCQHLNPHNIEAHALYTAREIEKVFGRDLDAVVVGVSTAGQIMGIAKRLKHTHPSIKIIGVDVEGSVIFNTPASPYKMTGIGLSFFPPNLDLKLLHSAYVIHEQLAFSVCHRLAKRDGMLLGASSGAIVAAGMHVAKSLGPKSRVLMINPDRGDRYLETIYDATWLAEHDFSLLNHAQIIEAIDTLNPILLDGALHENH